MRPSLASIAGSAAGHRKACTASPHRPEDYQDRDPARGKTTSLQSLMVFLTVSALAHATLFVLFREPLLHEVGNSPPLRVTLVAGPDHNSRNKGRETLKSEPDPRPEAPPGTTLRTQKPVQREKPAKSSEKQPPIRRVPAPASVVQPLAGHATPSSPPGEGAAPAEESPMPFHASSNADKSDTTPGPLEPKGEGRAGAGNPVTPMKAVFGTENGPRVLHLVRPEYPLRARRLRQEGRVLLRLQLDSTGKLRAVDVVKSAGHSFDEAAVSAVKKSQFWPALHDGRPTDCLVLLPIKFALEEP